MKRTLVSALLCILILASLLPVSASQPLLPWTGEEIVYKAYGADLGIKQDPNSPVYKAYKEKLGNITIQWQTAPWADFDEKTRIFLNTGDLPDIVWLRDSRDVIRDYGNMGYFLDFNQYKQYMPNLSKYQKEYPPFQYMQAANGAYYAINDIEPFDSLQEGWFVNKTKLDELGLKVPNTWPEMLEAMAKFKEANPNGTPFITYGWGFGYYKYIFSHINNATYRGMYYDGAKWAYSPSQEESGHRELIGILNELYGKGFIHPEFSTISNEQANQVVIDGNWLFSFFYGVAFDEIFVGSKPPYQVQAMLTPAKEAGAKRYGVLSEPYDSIPGWGYFANVKAQHPEVLAAVMDFIISPEASDLFNWGVKGVTYDVDKDGNKYYLEDYATNTERRKQAGINNIMDVRYIQLKSRSAEYARADAIYKNMVDMVTKAYIDGQTVAPRLLRDIPNVSTEEKEIVARSINPMKTYLEEQEMLFVDNTRPMSEWDAFVKELLGYGKIDEVKAIYEKAPQIIYSAERKWEVFPNK